MRHGPPSYNVLQAKCELAVNYLNCREWKTSLYQLQPLHAGMPVLADDEVIVHGNTERARDVDDRLCHLDIRLRGRRIAGGVIVHQHT